MILVETSPISKASIVFQAIHYLGCAWPSGFRAQHGAWCSAGQIDWAFRLKDRHHLVHHNWKLKQTIILFYIYMIRVDNISTKRWMGWKLEVFNDTKKGLSFWTLDGWMDHECHWYAIQQPNYNSLRNFPNQNSISCMLFTFGNSLQKMFINLRIEIPTLSIHMEVAPKLRHLQGWFVASSLFLVRRKPSKGEPDRNLHKANIQGHVGYSYTNLVHQLFVTLCQMLQTVREWYVKKCRISAPLVTIVPFERPEHVQQDFLMGSIKWNIQRIVYFAAHGTSPVSYNLAYQASSSPSRLSFCPSNQFM